MFAIGDRVTWRSQSGGNTTEKVGVVVAYIAPGERPDQFYFPDLHKGVGCGYGRAVESWVVRVGKRHYWPVSKNLRRVAVCPHCNGTGIPAAHPAQGAG